MTAAVTAAAGLILAAAPAQATATGPLGIDPDRRYDANTYLGTHNSFAASGDSWGVPNQDTGLVEQLDKGVRALNLDVYLVRQDARSGCIEVYQGESTVLGDGGGIGMHPICMLDWELGNEPLEVVVAHEPHNWGFFPHTGRYRTLADTMSMVHDWMAAHPREIVTVAIQNEVHSVNRYLITREFSNAGFSNAQVCRSDDAWICIFDPDGWSPMAVPGKDDKWNAVRHGYPTLRQMADANNRLVLFDDFYSDLVRVGGVGNSFDPNDWAEPNGDYTPDDHTKPIFLVEHIPSAPGIRPVNGHNYNGITMLNRKWSDIRERWDRMPQIIWFDFFDQDANHLLPNTATPADPSGPMRLVSHLNELRHSLPKIVAEPFVTPVAGGKPNEEGWSRGDVEIRYTASGDTPHRYLRSAWGAQQFGLRDDCRSVDSTGCQVLDTITVEGVTTVSASAVGYGGLGVRSDQAYVEAKIDKTAPSVSCTGNAGRYDATAIVEISCTASDGTSGVKSLSRELIGGPAYQMGGPGRVEITVTAVDRADNVTEHPVVFDLTVTFAMMRTLTLDFVSGPDPADAKKHERVLINQLNLAERADSRGDSSAKRAYLSAYIDYLQRIDGRYLTSTEVETLTRLANGL